MERKVRNAVAQTAASAVLWGTSFPATTYGIQSGLDPRLFVFLRFALATPIMMGASLFMGRKIAPLLKSRPVWVLGALNAAGFLTQYIGQQYTTAQIAALLVNLSVIFAAVGGALFLEEGFGSVKIIGILLAVLGTLLVTTGGDLSALTGASLLGDSLYLVAAVTWAWYIVYARRKTVELDWDPLPLSASVVFMTAILVSPFAALSSGFQVDSAPALSAIAFTAVLNTAVPFVLYQQGLRFLSSGTSALILMLEIVVALAVSVALLGEGITGLGVGGSAMILLSIGLVSISDSRGKAL